VPAAGALSDLLAATVITLSAAIWVLRYSQTLRSRSGPTTDEPPCDH